MSRVSLRCRFAFVLALLAWAAPSAWSQVVPLGTAANFGVLGASTVTNTGLSAVTGNLGVFPGTAITGFPPGTVTGTTHAGDAVAQQAQADAAAANAFIVALACDTILAGTLDGLTLIPGVYCVAAAATLTGTLTLDGQGDPNAVFIFKIGTTLTTATGANVVMTGLAQGCNVHWSLGTSATLGTNTALAGNIFAGASITMTTGSSLSGRAIALGAAVTMDTSTAAACFAVAPCPVITLAPALLPGGTVGTPYSQTVTASGSAALPYAYSLSSGALPPGLLLNPATGAVSGTPTLAGSYNFTITATDANLCFASQPYVIVIAPAACPVITLSPALLPGGTLGTPYLQSVTASGSVALPYTYSVSAGVLPPGLLLNPATGAISGTPTLTGTYPFTITATDTNLCPGSQPYVIVILAALCPVINVDPPLLPGGTVGTPYAQSVIATGSAALPYSYTVTSGSLPTGLLLNPITGAITGTPLAPGPFPFTVTATDALGCTGSTLYAIAIVPVGCFVVTVSPLVLPAGQVGVAYSAAITASPAGVYTFAVVAGSLPAGLVLNAATGVISGTPLAEGTSPVTIAATSAGGCIGTQVYLMGVGSGATAIPTLSNALMALLAIFMLCGGLMSMIREGRPD